MAAGVQPLRKVLLSAYFLVKRGKVNGILDYTETKIQAVFFLA